ncbi:hypothetical protein KIL84_014333, partial [Mauremys mutica]
QQRWEAKGQNPTPPLAKMRGRCYYPGLWQEAAGPWWSWHAEGRPAPKAV